MNTSPVLELLAYLGCKKFVDIRGVKLKAKGRVQQLGDLSFNGPRIGNVDKPWRGTFGRDLVSKTLWPIDFQFERLPVVLNQSRKATKVWLDTSNCEIHIICILANDLIRSRGWEGES